MNTNKVEAWKGFKDFKVYKKVKESGEIFSLYIKPVDGTSVIEHKAGQFIGIKVKTDAENMKKVIRMYSLSSVPSEEFYRVTIKLVEDGRMTNYLNDNINVGDIIEVMAPRGAFFLNKEKVDKPVVLLGGGIGVTPVFSMLQDIDENIETHFIYSLRNKEAECFLEDIKEFDKLDNTKVTTFFTRPLEGELEGKDFDIKGRVTKEWLASNVPLDAEFYFCGNKGFTEMLETTLEELGVEKDRIHFEFF